MYKNSYVVGQFSVFLFIMVQYDHFATYYIILLFFYYLENKKQFFIITQYNSILMRNRNN